MVQCSGGEFVDNGSPGTSSTSWLLGSSAWISPLASSRLGIYHTGLFFPTEEGNMVLTTVKLQSWNLSTQMKRVTCFTVLDRLVN